MNLEIEEDSSAATKGSKKTHNRFGGHYMLTTVLGPNQTIICGNYTTLHDMALTAVAQGTVSRNTPTRHIVLLDRPSHRRG